MPVDPKIPKYAQATPDADYVPHYADSKSKTYDTPDADYIPDYAKSKPGADYIPGYADAHSSYYHMSSYDIAESLKKVIDSSYRYAGTGSFNNIFQNFLSRLDRHGTAFVPLNAMNYGYTFITRPRLNMTSGNLLQHPVMATLNSYEPNSVAFMIRCLLDTRLSNGWPIKICKPRINVDVQEFSNNLVPKSGLVDRFNPFFIPLCNGLKGVSGWPDLNLETS